MLPDYLSTIDPDTKTPRAATLLTGIAISILVLISNIVFLAELVNLATLVNYFMTATILVLQSIKQEKKIFYFGLCVSIFAVSSIMGLIVETGFDGYIRTLIVFTLWAVLLTNTYLVHSRDADYTQEDF